MTNRLPDAPERDAIPPSGDSPPEVARLEAGQLVAGGRALCRTEAGEVVFVEGALPHEVVEVSLGRRRKGWRTGELLEVLAPAAERVDPRCPHVAEGCGGCDLAHAAPDAQPLLKVAIVIDALRRLGGLSNPPVVAASPLPSDAYRTTVRALTVDGRCALRRRASHDPVVLDRCLVAHPLVEEVLVGGRFPGAAEVTVRAGARTGERLVVVTRTARRVDVPEGVVVVGQDELAAGREVWIHEEVEGWRLRVSARSFFQSSHAGAAALVAEVRDAAGRELLTARRVLDAYAGVGLLGGALLRGLAAEGRVLPDLVAVEQAPSSVADAEVNLGGLGLDCDIDLLPARVEDVADEPADLVIADPARTGLGATAAERLGSSGAEVIVLVSCDAASLGRDAGLLVAQGFALERARVVDLFPQTTHVEVVSRFVRTR